MTDDERLVDLLMLAEDLRQQGQPVFPIELCREHPELLPELERLLEGTGAVEQLLHPTPLDPAGAETAGLSPAAAAPLSLPGYTILGELGRGGMGVVYDPRQDALGRRVALKVLRATLEEPERVARFQREVRVAARLQHPNIVPVYEVGQSEGVWYYAMRLIPGRPVSAVLAHLRGAGRPRWPAPESEPRRYFHDVARAGKQAAEALAYAHLHGVLHRDIKPDNLLVDDAGHIWITDFGLAKTGDEDLTKSGAVVGTLRYMAPEQMRGLPETRSDVYSLGLTLYELLVLRPAFDAPDQMQLFDQVIHGEPPRPRTVDRSVPGDLETIVLKAIRKEPAQRYGSAQEFADDLERYLEGKPILARPVPVWERAVKWARRRPMTAALTAMLVLAAGGSVFLLRQREMHRLEQAEQRRKLELEQAEQQRKLEMAARATLGKVSLLTHEERWPEARALLEQALDPQNQEVSEELRGELEQALSEVVLVGDLEAIRLKKASLGNKFDTSGADREYEQVFRAHRFGAPGDDPLAAAQRVRDSAVKGQLVAALDDWAFSTKDVARRAWLLEVARRADPDPWRDRLRDPAVWKDPKKMTALLAQAKSQELSPSLAVAISRALDDPRAVELLQVVQRQYPADFWINIVLGTRLNRQKQYADAVSYLRAAVAARGKAAAPRNDLGNALKNMGKVDEAIDCYRRATELDPRSAVALLNLGAMLFDKGKVNEAIACARRAIEADPQFALAHSNLGFALDYTGKRAEAIAAWSEAVRLDPSLLTANYWLARALFQEGRPSEAIEPLRQAASRAPAREPLAMWLHQQLARAERLAPIEKRLPQFLAGKEFPADERERLDLIDLCRLQRRFGAAARWWTEAFAMNPQLALGGESEPQHRYNAACCAALAGCGKGIEAKQLDDKQRARWRRQALTWLRADLTAWTERLKAGKPPQRGTLVTALKHWQKDGDLAGLRDVEALAMLPAEERQACQRLWADVAALLAEGAADNKRPEK